MYTVHYQVISLCIIHYIYIHITHIWLTTMTWEHHIAISRPVVALIRLDMKSYIYKFHSPNNLVQSSTVWY